MDRLVDWHWGIDTVTSAALSEKSGKFDDNGVNSSVSYYILFRWLGRTVLKPDGVLYDIGCGYGRVLCHAARQGISKAVGVELSPAFADKARANARTLRRRLSPIEVRSGDAVDMDYADGTAFFLYDPFGSETLRSVLDRIRRTTSGSPRPLRFIYLPCPLLRPPRVRMAQARRDEEGPPLAPTDGDLDARGLKAPAAASFVALYHPP